MYYRSFFVPEFVVGPNIPTVLHFSWTVPEDCMFAASAFSILQLNLGWNDDAPPTDHTVRKWKMSVSESDQGLLLRVSAPTLEFYIDKNTFKDMSGQSWQEVHKDILFTFIIEQITE